MTAAAPDRLCDLTKTLSCVTRFTPLNNGVGAGSLFFAASWTGDASRDEVQLDGLCSRTSITQAALPLLQELKSGVAPSIDTASACGRDQHYLLDNVYKHLIICDIITRRLDL